MFESYIKEMVETRRALHRRPELGWTEFETTWYVCSHLEKWGIPYLLGTQVINPKFVMGRDEEAVKDAIDRAKKHGVPADFIEKTEGYTGAAAIIETGRPGPVTAIRCDMDALPVSTAVGLEVARWIHEHKDDFCGTIKILFQPAEEGVRGGLPMSESGIVDDVDWLLGSHVGGVLHSGEVCAQDGGFMASTKFDIEFTGQEAHAGSDPQKGHSALVAAACATMMLQGIPRHREGETRVSVGKLVAGEGRNIVAAHALMQMEVRGGTQAVNDFMVDNVNRIIEAVETAYQVKAKITRVGETSTLVVCPPLLDKVEEAMRAVPGIKILPRYHGADGSEDCSWLIRKVASHGGQAAYFIFGCEHKGHHRPDFDIQDEKNLPVAFNVFVNFAKLVNGKN